MQKKIKTVPFPPAEELAIMEKYFHNYGDLKEFLSSFDTQRTYLDIKDWLKYWSHSKTLLYKLLGHSLTLTKTYTIPSDELKEKQLNNNTEILNEIYESSSLRRMENFFIDMTASISSNDENLLEEISKFFNVKRSVNPQNGTLCRKFIFPFEKKLVIQEGTKYIKACKIFAKHFCKILDHLTALPKRSMNLLWILTCNAKFEEFNTKIVYDNLMYKIADIEEQIADLNKTKREYQVTLSIHPMDFMTMSDNDSNWTSCMSWTDDGCYKTGSVEMMNSNCVLMAYLTSKKTSKVTEIVGGKWHNGSGKEELESLNWNSKTWRQLFYFTPDTIISGKSYPNAKEEITIFILQWLKELAETNLKRTYRNKIERYVDFSAVRPKDLFTKEIFHNEDKGKKRLLQFDRANLTILDTMSMYNDHLNTSTETAYFQIKRKKVSHKPRLIQVSGKCNCVSCNTPFVKPGYSLIHLKDLRKADLSDYNDRYEGDSFFCPDCLEKSPVCFNCESKILVTTPTKMRSIQLLSAKDVIDLKEDNSQKEEIKVFCPNCMQSFAFCSHCHRFFKKDYGTVVYFYQTLEDNRFLSVAKCFNNHLKYNNILNPLIVRHSGENDWLKKQHRQCLVHKVKPLNYCGECLAELSKNNNFQYLRDGIINDYGRLVIAKAEDRIKYNFYKNKNNKNPLEYIQDLRSLLQTHYSLPENYNQDNENDYEVPSSIYIGVQVSEQLWNELPNPNVNFSGKLLTSSSTK